MKRLLMLCALITISLAAPADHDQVFGKATEGIRNLRVIDSKVACAGSITPENVSGIKDMGFASIINLRREEEQGARLEEEASAARAAGINYIHIPFNGRDPQTAAVDTFLAALADPANAPAFIHCAGGSRAASMWYTKRVLQDGLDKEHALAEAKELGLGSEALEAFMNDYIDSHR